MNQPTKPDDFLPLPTSFASVKRIDGTDCPAYTADQVCAAILADRAARQPVAGSVDTDELKRQLRVLLMDNVRIGPAKAEDMATAILVFVKAAGQNTHPAPRDVDAPIVLPEKPEPTINGTVYHEEHNICYTAPVHYTAVQMDAHATAAVQKDRADRKGQTG